MTRPRDRSTATPLRIATLFGAAVVALACLPRDGVPAVCPQVAQGDLVVSELRGPQEGADSFGQWIEVFNASD